MLTYLFLFLTILVSSIYLYKDRRNFIAGIFFAGSCINLTLLATLGIAAYLAGDSRIGIISLAVFLLLGIIVVPLLVGFSLIINTYVMQTREGKSLTAKLSLIFGVNLLLVLGAGAAILLANQYLGRLTGILFVFIGIDVTFTFIFSCYLFYSFLYQIIPIREKVDYIITLGAGIRSETVTPLLKGRLDKALEYFWKQDGNPKLVVSGGQGPDEPVSEAYAMAKYLKSQHVSEDKIILEDQSTTTLQNMKFSKQKIEKDWKKSGMPKVIFATNNYHVLRSAIYARKAGLNANGVGSPTSFYFLPSALIREYIALLVIYKKTTIAIVLGWIILGLLLAFF